MPVALDPSVRVLRRRRVAADIARAVTAMMTGTRTEATMPAAKPLL